MQSLKNTLLFLVFLTLPFPIREVFVLGGPQDVSFNEYRDISAYFFEILILLYLLVNGLYNRNSILSTIKKMFHVEHSKILLTLLTIGLILVLSTAPFFTNLVLLTKWLLYLYFLRIVYSEAQKTPNVPRGTSTVIERIANCSTWNILKVSVFFSLLVQVFIALIQVFLQKSIGLIYLFEPVLDPAIAGVATFILGESEILRGYGTFLHPNILAMYLVLMSFFVIVPRGTLVTNKNFEDCSTWNKLLKKMFHVEHLVIYALFKPLFIIIVVCGVIATASKTALGALILVGGYWFWSYLCSTWNTRRAILSKMFHVEHLEIYSQKNVPRGTSTVIERIANCSTWNIFTLVLILLTCIGVVVLSRDLDWNAYFLQPILERKTQYVSIFDVQWYQWVLGFGLSGYITEMMLLHPKAPLWQFQPLHNFWVMAVLELGVMTILCLILLFWEKMRYYADQARQAPEMTRKIVMSGGVLLLIFTLSDHYFWDIEPAQLTGLFFCFFLFSLLDSTEPFLQTEKL